MRSVSRYLISAASINWTAMSVMRVSSFCSSSSRQVASASSEPQPFKMERHSLGSLDSSAFPTGCARRLGFLSLSRLSGSCRWKTEIPIFSVSRPLTDGLPFIFAVAKNRLFINPKPTAINGGVEWRFVPRECVGFAQLLFAALFILFGEAIDNGVPQQDFLRDRYLTDCFCYACPSCLDRLGELRRRADWRKNILLSPVTLRGTASGPDLDLITHPRRA